MIKKGIFLTAAVISSLVLVFTPISIINAINKDRVQRQYTIEVASIENLAADLEDGIGNTASSEDKPVKELICNLEVISKADDLMRRLELLNKSPEYVDMIKKDIDTIRKLEEMVNKLQALEKGVSKMNEILNRSSEIDKSFEQLKENMDCSYEDALDTVEKLRQGNSKLINELTVLTYGDNIKPLQRRLEKMFQFRKNSLDSYYRAVLTDFESVITIAACNDNMEDASGFINTAKLSRGNLASFTQMARSSTRTARDQQVAVVKNMETSKAYYSESDAMLKKYNELLGETEN